MLDRDEMANLWFKRAISSFKKSVLAENDSDVFYEDLCFDLQQSVEKSLKSLLTYKNIEFPKTHSLNVLSSLLLQSGEDLPEDVIESVGLTMYAVQTRYPGEYDEITKDDYEKAKSLAMRVLQYCGTKISHGKIFE